MLKSNVYVYRTRIVDVDNKSDGIHGTHIRKMKVRLLIFVPRYVLNYKITKLWKLIQNK